MQIFFRLAAIIILLFNYAIAQKKKPTVAPLPAKSDVQSTTFAGLKFRSIGPALTSGRIIDLAVNPKNKSEYYVAAASSGVWKTTNAGITYQPIFDNEASYSIGCVVIDPVNTNVVWVGSGENNNQRSVAYGDGVYKSEDAGKTWKNVGLKTSEHIGKIAIDPTNTDIVYVAAYGPLWKSGGERGIYKTTDGGKTWKAVLTVSENTGFNDVLIDPRNPNTIYAAAHQRQRKVFTYIGGGPESALYKSTDGGVIWNKIMKGLPSDVDLGRIGIAISPVNPDVLYAMVEASADKGGFFASSDRGASWEKRSNVYTSGNYYQEIFCDPVEINRIYSMDSYAKVSDDGGKTFRNLGEKSKHVDNHVIWIDPDNNKHLLEGCDGGLYETYDGAQTWGYKANLPLTQFYKVSLDNSRPFYNVYGGTQDNFSLGGPSRTRSENGIVNSDWFVTTGGDGFESQADYIDSNIVYAESQYGGLVRFDKKSGETIDIKPIEASGEAPYRWNWDAPLLISQHDHKRLYFASNKVFRTDDQGNTWRQISGDLSRGLDRNRLTIMGRVWSVDAVAKNQSTDIYGQVTTVAESVKDENVLYAGTDDGLIWFTKDGGKNWSKVDNLPGVPQQSYVQQIIGSNHDKNVAYAAYNDHRYGDFKPYILKTTDGGRTWNMISSNLPENGAVYSLAEDHVNPALLFAGTEFGVFFSNDGGGSWTQLKGGLPTIAVRDMEIQRRESDLVLATFGRGFYVLDDYSMLRNFKKEDLQKQAFIAPVKASLMYVQSSPLGVRNKGFQGENYYNAPNPMPGAVFTYFVKDEIKTLKEKRQQAERERIKTNQPPFYPAIDTLRMEDIEPAPFLLFTITDDAGNAVRRIKTSPKKGLNRIIWDFRTEAKTPVSISSSDESMGFNNSPRGILVMPGTYKVSLSKYAGGVFTQLVAPQPFNVEALNINSLAATDKRAVYEFGRKVAELYRVVSSTDAYKNDLSNKLKYMKEAAIQTPASEFDLINKITDLERRLNEVTRKLNGDASLSRREFEAPTSIQSRIGDIMEGLISATFAPTNTFMTSYNIAAADFAVILAEVKSIGEEVKRIENVLEQSGAPYTPGRVPEWRK
ncbi:hypothetical protein BH09BAC2_BH09BAC2_12450 [soil metagenome]